MPESMRYRLTDERHLLMDKLRGQIDDLPDSHWKADLLDMALINLLETVENHETYDGDPQLAKRFATSVVRPKYRAWIDVKRA